MRTALLRAWLVVALASGLAGTVGASPSAAAQGSPEPSVDALRAQADAIAERYFAALTQANELDAEVEAAQAEVAELEQRAERARETARAHAVIAYRQSGSRLSAVIDGADALDAARRARLIDHVNERDRDVFDELTEASRQLQGRRHELEAARTAQEATLADLRQRGEAVDAKLAEAARREAALQAAAARVAAPAPSPATAAAGAATGTVPSTTTAPTTTTTAAVPVPPAAAPAPPTYSGTPGTYPQHDDPFLTCVRARESSGNYGAVNPAGPYLGAYQFLQSTWNAAANRARRAELVGVPPNRATPYDQDDVAWALYQWQGAGPWGGACK